MIYERGKEGGENWGAYVPDLPGCVTTRDTLEETRRHIREAIELYLRGMREDGETIPEPTIQVEQIRIAA